MIKKLVCITLLGGFAFVLASAELTAGDPDQIKAWIEQLQKPTLKTRILAAASLGETGNLGDLADAALAPLGSCLEDSNSDVRVYAAFALGRVGGNHVRTISLLSPLLIDPDEHVRYSAEWSLAEVAKVIASLEITDEMASKLLGLFRSIEVQMLSGTFQERHVIAVKLARIRLESRAGSNEAAPKVATKSVEVAPISKEGPTLETNMLVSISLYEAIDIVGRLALVDRMTSEKVFDDKLRLGVLKHELQGQDLNVVSYALVRWQSKGSLMMAQLFDELTDADLSSTYGENVVRSLVPTDLRQWEKLCKIIASRSYSVDLRIAGLHVVESCWNKDASSPAFLSLVPSTLQKLISDPAEDEQVRIPAIAAFAKLAHDSSGAANVVVECLKGTDTDSAMFYPLVEALGSFGKLGADGIGRLIDGLSAKDAETRRVCTESLGKVGSSLGKVGSVAQDAVPALVALIVNPDEVVEVKSQAASSLKQMGSMGVEALISSIGHPDAKVREHVLRALSIAANSNTEIAATFLGKLSDTQEAGNVRASAAAGLGAVGSLAKESTAAALRKACEETEPTELRAAAIIALARIDREQAKIVIDANKDDAEWLIRASAAFGLHLCGSTSESIESLLGLLDASERDQLVLSALSDLGTTASPHLLRIAQDTERSMAERLCCIEALFATPPVPWPAIIQLLDDDEIGDQTASLLESAELFESEVAPLLIGRLGSGKLNASTRYRIIRVLEADGFGAVEDESKWADTFSLNQPEASRFALSLPKKKKTAIKLDAPASPPPPTASAAVLPSPPTTGVELPATETMTEFVADGSSERKFIPGLIQGDDRKVAVFYGTNRLPLASQVKSTPVTSLHVGLAGVAIAIMFGCFFLFPRQSWIRYGIASLMGMGAFSAIALQAMIVMSWQAVGKEQPRYSGLVSEEIQYGVCEVSIPEGHQAGELESPQLFKFEVTLDPEKHVVLTNVECMPVETFRAALRSEMDRKGKNIFVFLHGYNVSFEDAARRTAQMAYDLKFEGAPVFYSWPSQAKWYSYVMDKDNIQLSVAQIRSFLIDIATTSQADTINLIAHSMGNVGLTAALSEIEQTSTPYFNQVVLAAPDIDADVFKNEIASKIVSKSHRTTLYTSKSDLALISSRYFNQRNRAGDSGPEVIVLDGIETIDATAVDSSLLGHSYYGSNVTVLDDLGLLLKNKPIESREYLKAIVRGRKPYWAFEPTRISRVQSRPIEISR